MLNITTITNMTREELINETIRTTNITINQGNQINILIGLVLIILIGAVIYLIIYEKKTKTLKETKQTQKELQTLVETLQKIDTEIGTGTVKVNEININNLPKELKTELLEKTNILNKIFADSEDKIEPIMLLMLNNRTIEIKTNVKIGELILTSKDAQGKEIKKMILIGDNDIQTLKFGKKKAKIIIAHEDQAIPYPHYKDEKASRSLYQLIENIKMSEGLMQPTTKGFPKIIILIGIAIIIGGIVLWWWTSTQGTGIPPETITQNITNITQTAQNMTVKVIKV